MKTMKTFTYLKSIFSFVFFVFATGKLTAQNNPIGCNGQYYVSHGPISGANGATALEKLVFSGLTLTPNSYTLSPSTYGFNAMGLNPIDGYIYAIRYPASNGKGTLVKIGSGGTNITDLGTIPALNNNEIAYSATFDANGDFYFTTDDGRFMKIVAINNPANAASLTTTQIVASGFDSYADIAINPLDGQMYGTNNLSTNWLFKINKSTGVITSISGEPSLGGSNFFASLFFDERGNMFGYRSDGPFYLINKSNGALTAAGNGVSYSGADGCSCSFGRVFHELDMDPNQICSIGQNPYPVFSITSNVINQSIAQQTGLTYTFEIPGNRFSFNQDVSTIAANLFAAGVIPSNTPGFVTISSTSGTKNKLVVTNFQTGAPTTTKTFQLELKLTTIGGVYNPVSLQSEISGLPSALGSTDLSNDPETPTPDDATIVTFCSNITLPVVLEYFSANLKNDAVLVNWEATVETNFSHYILQRSYSGNDFEDIATVFGTEKAGAMKYSYNDASVNTQSPVAYYRLLMVDKDGKAKYSDVKMVRFGKQTENAITIVTFPNPVTNELKISIPNSWQNKKVTYDVFNNNGQVSKKLETANSSQTESVNVSSLAPGFYIVRVSCEGQTALQKIIKY